VELLVGYAAGGSTDLAARVLAEGLAKKWGIPVSVINKPGASGTTAVLETRGARPDGSTLLAHVNAGVTNPALNPALPYRWNELKYVLRMVTSPLVVVVNPGSPFKSAGDLINALKNDPTKLKLGLSGAGGSGLFATVQMAQAAKFDASKVVRVVQAGGNQVAASVAGGHVDYAVQYVVEVEDLVKAGKLRALAVVNGSRVSALPDVPTAAEVGLPQLNWQPWIGIAAPPGTPDDIVSAWNRAVQDLLADKDFAQKLERLGFVPAYLDAPNFESFSSQFFETAIDVRKVMQ
jgi:tripartite-type tricarboxylate transporter receptor subunit TctC